MSKQSIQMLLSRLAWSRAVRGEFESGDEMEPGLSARIRAERVGLVFHNTLPALVGNILVAALGVIVVLPLAPRAGVVAWFLTFLAIMLVRWWGKRAYDRRAEAGPPSSDVWARRLFLMLTLNGIWWGLFAILLLSYADRFQAGFAPFVIGGMVAAAVATLGALRSAYLGFTLPMVLCMVAVLVWQGERDTLLMAGFAVAFEITMIGTVWQVSAIVSRNIELRVQNERLVTYLTQSNSDLAGLNVDLAHEIEERKRAEARSEFLATHDALTGLPNRRTQKDRFVRASLDRRPVAILFLDLDKFKAVNDRLGHGAGDSLLCVVADRLRDCLRRSDSVCRHGGDEFMVLISDAADQATVGGVAERIIESVSMPIELEKTQVQVGCSIGISFYPHDGEDFELLVSRADQALYRAKDGGRAGYRFFSVDLDRCDTTGLSSPPIA